MEVFLSQIEWFPVIISTVITMMLGYLWYSPVLFLQTWLKGLPEPPKWQAPMWLPVIAQVGALLFLAMVVNRLQSMNEWILLLGVTFTIMGFTKANGMYSGKTKTSISVEVTYILASVLIMIITSYIL